MLERSAKSFLIFFIPLFFSPAGGGRPGCSDFVMLGQISMIGSPRLQRDIR